MLEGRIQMQQNTVQQEQQASVSHDGRQQFIEEISTLRSLAKVTGAPANLLEEFEGFKHEIEHLDASAWEQKEVRALKRSELARLSLAMLRAFYSRPG